MMNEPIPAENTIVRCRACGARIFFAQTKNLKSMPLDAKPVKAIVIEPFEPGEARYSETQYNMRFIDSFVSHFSTCPEAGKFRKE